MLTKANQEERMDLLPLLSVPWEHRHHACEGRIHPRYSTFATTREERPGKKRTVPPKKGDSPPFSRPCERRYQHGHGRPAIQARTTSGTSAKLGKATSARLIQGQLWPWVTRAVRVPAF